MNAVIQMKNPRDHALFRQHPLAGEVALSTGPAPMPYHVYDGHGVFIGGTADLPVARELLQHEQLVPVVNEAGRALMGIWVFDFGDASLGPHHELQFSLFVGRPGTDPVPAHGLGLLEAMLKRPEVQMLCHGLWNSTPRAVAYNRELLALNARCSRSVISRDDRALQFSVTDAQTQASVLAGRLALPQRPSLRANLALMRRLGLRQLVQVARQPWIRMPVVNPVGEGLARNAVADSFTRADASVLRYAHPGIDRLVFGDTRYRRLAFEPQFVQFMAGFKFVYLFPR